MVADQMAGDAAPVGSGCELWGESRAKGKRYRTARMECAAARSRSRIGRISLQNRARPMSPRPGHRGNERPRIGMQRIQKNRLRGAFLDDGAEIHHSNPIADQPDYSQIMADEDHRHAPPRLQILQKIDHLRLDRDVERRYWLVADKEIWIGRKRSGQDSTLA